MRRLLLLLTVAAMMAAMMALAGPASATIHPLACSEKSNAPAGTAAATQNPPGLTPGSQAQSEQEATPVAAVGPDSPALKPPGC